MCNLQRTREQGRSLRWAWSHACVGWPNL